MLLPDEFPKWNCWAEQWVMAGSIKAQDTDSIRDTWCSPSDMESPPLSSFSQITINSKVFELLVLAPHGKLTARASGAAWE